MITRGLLAVVCAVVATAGAGSAAWGGTTLSLSKQGIVVDNGGDEKFTISYPVPVNAAKKAGKVADASVDESDPKKATVKFEGGGAMAVTIKDEDVLLRFSDMPEGTKNTLGTVSISAPYKGKYLAGKGEAKEFPAEKADKPMMYQGSASQLVITGASDTQTYLVIPDFSYLQIQDMRQYGRKAFLVQFWSPFYPENPQQALKFHPPQPKKEGGKETPAKDGPKGAEKPKEAAKEAAAEVDPNAPAQVLKWKDGKKAVFLLQFDDACPSHLKYVIPELKKRKIVGTFYVIAGNGMFRDQKQWAVEAKESGVVELANHTMNHGDVGSAEQFDKEIKDANDAINSILSDRKPNRLISFGRPGGVKYKVTNDEIKTVLAKYNCIERPSFYGGGIHLKTAEEMTKWIDTAIGKGEMGHIDFHGVGGDWLKVSLEEFNAVLDKLEANKDKLWVTDHMSWHKYQTERKTAQVKVLQADDKQVTIELTSQADPALYDMPLTVSAKVPLSWKKCSITQGEAKATAPVVAGAAKFDAVPGSKQIVLQPAE